jgi:hypothetical protein
MNEQEIKQSVLSDFFRVVGHVIFPQFVDGYIGDDSFTVATQGLHPMRVCPTNERELVRWMGDECDPCWDVTPVYPEEFQQLVKEENPEAEEPMRSLWVFGHSYEIGKGKIAPADLQYRDTFEKLNPIS